ncbi:MAG: MerR family transcriptional regulator [Limnoraphis sp. WC205]|jgi:DNA-binding transcriptional MerR regulator|nr:MerR family transcriptional regulator [Limnoraphis sp. WC205]
MSDFKPTPDTNLTMAQLLERYRIGDEATLRTWAQLHGLNGNHGIYSPNEVELIDHVHHHLHNLGMSIDEYKKLVNRRLHPPSYPSSGWNSAAKSQSMEQPISQPNPSVSNSVYSSSENHSSDQTEKVVQEASGAIEMLMEQYSEAIDYMGEQIADQFIDELDVSVMRHLSRKVQQRLALNGQARSNRLMKAIQGVFQSKNKSLLMGSPSEDSSLHMENTHRLG